MSRGHTDVVRLTEGMLLEAMGILCARNPDLALIVAQFGPPPLWAREPGFATLLYIILEQQVSLASARAAYARLITVVSPLTPETFLALDDAELRAVGFSRQKARYGRLLAEAVLEGRLDLAALETVPDDDVREALMAQKGIGPWTADIYLMEALLRPDIWPTGDIALATAAQQLKGLPARPTPQELDALGVPYRPWRAVAARLFWHYYLS